MSRSLQDAVTSGSVGEVEVRLNMGEDVNHSFPPRYLTCLHAAVLGDNRDIMELLLRRGAEVNQGDREGITPLSLAISLDKRSMASLLSSAGGSTSPSVVPVIDIKHDPILSHPPPWANKEKIYAVVNKKSDNLPQHNFQVKKFDFKMFDKKEEKKIEQKKPEENKYDIIKKFTKKNTTETTNDVKGMKTSEILDKNVTENTVKSVNVNSEVTTIPHVENIYDHVIHCDTIQVITDTDEPQLQQNDNNSKQNNALSKVKSTSERFYKKSSEKTKLLKDKIVTILPRKRFTNDAKTETNDGHCREENSLVKRFMRKYKSSKIIRSTREKVKSVKINGPKDWKVFNSVGDKLSFKLKENKDDTKEVEGPELLRNNIAEVKTSDKRSEKKENPKLTSLKNRLSDFTKLKRNNRDSLETDKFKFLRTKVSVTNGKLQDLKHKMPSLNRKKTDDKNKLKTNESPKSFNFPKLKLFDKVKSDNNPKKLLNNLNIKQKWSDVKNSKEFSKTDSKPKYSTLKFVREKKTRFSDEISVDFSNLNSLPRHEDKNGARTSARYESKFPGGESGKYKWNYIDGQWRKSQSLGL